MLDSTRSQKCASESPEKQVSSESAGKKPIPSKSLNGSFKSLRSSWYQDSDDVVEKMEDDAASNDAESEFDGLAYKDTKNFANTMRILDALRKNRQLCDLVLQLDNDSQEIYCHQIILACNSKFFMEIFTNYEREHQDAASNGVNNGSAASKLNPEINAARKKSVVELVNRNKNSSHNQLLFCLSDYLRDFLRDTNNHHNAKLNTILHHNSHYHHHHHHHPNNLTYNVDTVGNNTNELNHNLDYEALKICIDFMYTGKLRVPSYLIPHVYTLAYHLSFESIVQVCAQYLSSHLNVDNCLSIRSFALDEKLIEASTQCIEKNIEYILQINPKCLTGASGKLSTSLNSLANTLNGQKSDSLENSSSLSCSINLAHNEFNHLPRINIELVGIGKFNLPHSLVDITQFCMRWLIDVIQTRKTHSLNDLCDNLNMLYMNSADHKLHDCCEMDVSDSNFNDYINDYKKKHNSEPTNESANLPDNIRPPYKTQTSMKIKAFKITDQDMNDIGKPTPIKLKTIHENEIISSYQVSKNSFISICTLTGKLVVLSVHLLASNQIAAGDNANITTDKSLVSPSVRNPDVDQVLNDAKSVVSDTDSPTLTTSIDWDMSQQNANGSKLAKMQLSRCSHGLVSHQNKLYIIGGYDRGECISACEVYDPKINKIVDMRSMESRRGRAAIAWIESEKSIYVLGGSDGHAELNTIERFDIDANKWSTIKLDFDLSFTNLGAIACKNFIYLVGVKQEGQPRTCCLKFEPKTNTFARLADLNYGRSQSALVWTCTKNEYFIYVFGGYDQNKCLSSCEVYDVQDDKWSVIASMYEPRRGCGAAFHEKFQSVYIVGGTNGSKSLKSVEIYDILGKKWTSGPELNVARTNVSIAFIGDILFAVGGYDGKSFIKTIEYLNCKNLSNGWSLYHDPSDFDFI